MAEMPVQSPRGLREAGRRAWRAARTAVDGDGDRREVVEVYARAVDRARELDALQWTDLDFTPGAETIRVERQWNVKAKKLTPPKHDSRRTIALVEPLHARLLALPRESEWVFTTLRGHHYVPSTRSHHWNRVRAAIGIGTTALYSATRHYFAWYALNALELPDHVVALQLGHTDGGTLVRELYGHPDAAIARERIRAAFREAAPVVALPTTSRERGAA